MMYLYFYKSRKSISINLHKIWPFSLNGFETIIRKHYHQKKVGHASQETKEKARKDL